MKKYFDKIGREVTVKMYYNFVDLKDASPVLREAVEDIQMILIDKWNYEEKLENDRMLKLLTNSDYLLAEVMSLEGKDDRAVMLLQMAVYRFCKIHFKEILKSKRVPGLIQGTIEGGSYKEYDCFEFFVGDEIKKGFKEWEYKFWFDNQLSQPSYIFFRKEFINERRQTYRRVEAEDDRRADRVKEIIKMALEDEKVIREVEELRNKYCLLSLKAEKMNAAVEKEGEDRKLVEIHKLKKIIEIMEKNFKGKLTSGDILELEKYAPEWNDNIQKFEEIFSEM